MTAQGAVRTAPRPRERQPSHFATADPRDDWDFYAEGFDADKAYSCNEARLGLVNNDLTKRAEKLFSFFGGK